MTRYSSQLQTLSDKSMEPKKCLDMSTILSSGQICILQTGPWIPKLGDIFDKKI